MRPKKRVLLIDSDKIGQSTMRFLLDVKGYRVLSASSPDEALQVLDTVDVDVILLRDRGRSVELMELSAKLTAARRKLSFSWEHFPLLFVSAFKDRRNDDPSFDHVIWEHAPKAELMESLRMLAARRRGPSKKPVQSVIAESEAESIRRRA